MAGLKILLLIKELHVQFTKLDGIYIIGKIKIISNIMLCLQIKMKVSLNSLKSLVLFVIILSLSFISSSCKNITTKGDIHKPENWGIKISGMIDDGANYSARVIYRSHSDHRWCKSRSWGLFTWGKYSQDREIYEYFPEIKNGHHHLFIPIGELDPKGWCKFEAESIKLCVYTKGMPYSLSPCNKWFIRNHLFSHDYETVKNNNKLNDILDIECILQKYGYPSFPFYKCFLGDIGKKSGIEEKLTRGYSEYKVNIKLITVKDNN